MVSITRPKIPYSVFNPHIYQLVNDAGSLKDIARLLKAPEGWEDTCNQVLQHQGVSNALEDLKSLDEERTSEIDVQIAIIRLVTLVSDSLLLKTRSRSEHKVVVGGLLAKYEYDYLSQTDPFFTNHQGQALLATEVKTAKALDTTRMWYEGCKGAQVLGALYGHSCPTFLLSQKYWKVFIENSNRNGIVTYPFDKTVARDHLKVKANTFKGMGTTLVKVIVLCLLSKREPLYPPSYYVSNSSSLSAQETPRITLDDSKADRAMMMSNEDKPSKRARLMKRVAPVPYNNPADDEEASRRVSQQPILSRILWGHTAQNEPIYYPVWIASQEKVARISAEMERLAVLARLQKQEEEKRDRLAVLAKQQKQE